MSRLKIILSLLLIFLQACSANSTDETYSFSETISTEDVLEISIEMREGNLEIETSSGEELQILSDLKSPTKPEISWRDNKINIIHQNSQGEDWIKLKIPNDKLLKITTYSSHILITNFSGNIDARSTAGDFTIENLSGHATIWAGRGNISLNSGAGQAILIGEHGELKVNEFNGDVSMTTIMGTLIFSGIKETNNQVHLESDHGPIKIRIPTSANTAVQVKTTSGTTTCLGVDFSMTPDGCIGKVGDGSGEVTVRTVSGGVNLIVTDTSIEE